jgi:hypothetical protein
MNEIANRGEKEMEHVVRFFRHVLEFCPLNHHMELITDILEDGLELRKSYGPHAEEGGEILTGMYAQGCTTIEDSCIRGQSGRPGGIDAVSGVGSKVPALAMSTQGQYLPT